MYVNNFLECKRAGKLCTSFGIKISSNALVVQIARNADFDCLFIDLEHGWLSLSETANLCNVGNMTGITPFVCLPPQCGSGFVQRVLDGGAMGVFFPHIESPEEAEAAVTISKYPPLGCRSIIGQAPLFGMCSVPPAEMMELTNQTGSSVFIMIESLRGVGRVEEIVLIDGVDAIVVGCQDLSVDLGVPGQVDSDQIRSALDTVSMVCWKHNKIFGVAGIYDDPGLQDWVINTLGARFMLVQHDSSILTSGAIKAVITVPPIR